MTRGPTLGASVCQALLSAWLMLAHLIVLTTRSKVLLTLLFYRGRCSTEKLRNLPREPWETWVGTQESWLCAAASCPLGHVCAHGDTATSAKEDS